MRTIVIALALAALAAADTVVCKDGRKIEGKIIEETDVQVKVQVRNGAVTIPRYQIQEVLHGATTLEVYEQRRSRVDASDPVALLDLAKWAHENHLEKQSLAEYQRILDSGPEPGPVTDPENITAGEKARRAAYRAAHEALKHTWYDDRWMTWEEFCKAKGLVEFDGAWMTPEEAKLKAALKEQKELEKALADKVRECLRKLTSADLEVRDEARAQLDSIPGEFKMAPLLENVENRSAEVRAYCIGALSLLNRPEALSRLARRALVDESEALRTAALDGLKKLSHPDTWTHLQKGLASEYSYVRIRAANALCEFPNELAAESLMNALSKAAAPKGGVTFGTTEADPRFAGGTKMSPEARKAMEEAGKLPGGKSGGMDPFSDPEDKARKEQAEREKVAFIRALETCTGLKYGENLEMWREWFLQKKAATAAKAELGGKDKDEEKK